jgi:hypothetical protein
LLRQQWALEVLHFLGFIIVIIPFGPHGHVMLSSMLLSLEVWLGLLWWPHENQLLRHRVQVPNSGGENILLMGY